MSEHGLVPNNLQAEVSVPGPRPSPVGALAQLLVELFSSAARISAFARSCQAMEVLAKDLPGDNVPATEMAMALAIRLQEQGLVTIEFFDELNRGRPLRSAEIHRVAESWLIKVTPRPNILSAKPLRSAFLLIAGTVGLVTLTGLMILGERPQGLSFSDRWTPPVPSVSSANSTRGYAPFLGPEVIVLDPPSFDSVTLKVISTTTGRSWRVSISRLRSAESAARVIFSRLHLKNDPDITEMFFSGKFELCMAGSCHSDDLLHEIVSPDQAVAVQLNNHRCVLPCGPEKEQQEAVQERLNRAAMDERLNRAAIDERLIQLVKDRVPLPEAKIQVGTQVVASRLRSFW